MFTMRLSQELPWAIDIASDKTEAFSNKTRYNKAKRMGLTFSGIFFDLKG